ncbi:MAG: hypothetical protein PHQ74_05540 [Crocinitomicaceae bacterium]|nr:hypothetical protein [Crocinitomicaceae bacterium]
MKFFISFILLFQVFTTVSAQGVSNLTAEEKAYFFHIVRKSPILEHNIGRYFEYNGPDIRFSNKKINYDSLEIIIINQPDLLFIRTSEIAKSPKGLLAEAANKMAIWELNKTLLAKRLGDKELEMYQTQYEIFEEILIEKIPMNAFKYEGGKRVPHPKLDNVLNPSLSFSDKKTLVGTFSFLDLNDQLATLEAINASINKYVEIRAAYFYRALGGEAKLFKNVLVAAGDGSSTSGLLEEREKDEKGRWNKGLPKAVGLFPYQMRIEPATKSTKALIEPLRITANDFYTVGNHKITNIHMDVWGYNAEKQTTVVIEKNGLAYPLFGSGETRFLSPDSAFGKGATFASVINELKSKISKLDEMIFGKRGFDYWIEYQEKRKQEQLLKIDQNSENISYLRSGQITTSKKSKKVGHDMVVDKTKSGKKARKVRQESLVQQYAHLEAIKKKIEQLKKDKLEAIDLQAQYQRKLDTYLTAFGRNWATFTQKNGLFTFQDSTTFDLLTQEFQFPAKENSEAFEIRLIAIPYSSVSNQADEVMLHINVLDALPDYDARLQLNIEDEFASDQWELKRALLTEADSVAVRQFFEALLDKKLTFKTIARGHGLGKWNGAKVVKDNESKEMDSYPTATAENSGKYDSTFVRLRKTEVLINLNRSITLEVNSYTDPVKSNINITEPAILDQIKKYQLTKNQILSAYRSAEVLLKLRDEMNVLAGEYFDRTNAKTIIDRLNTEVNNTKITVGPASFKINQLIKR